ncbi:MAG: protein jag [Bryobacteraceae bacterium]
MSGKKYTVESVIASLGGFLRPLLNQAGLELDYTVEEGGSAHPDFENPDVVVKFSGADVDQLLANRAELLLALEHLAMEYMRAPSDDHSKLSFDANDYRMLRIEELRMSAGAAAEKVKRTGQPFFFNPMNSRERRVIHLALREESALRSESVGAGPQRQVVVCPAGMATIPAPPPPRPAPRPMSGGAGRPPGRFERRPGGDRDRDRRRDDRPPRRGPRR